MEDPARQLGHNSRANQQRLESPSGVERQALHTIFQVGQ